MLSMHEDPSSIPSHGGQEKKKGGRKERGGRTKGESIEMRTSSPLSLPVEMVRKKPPLPPLDSERWRRHTKKRPWAPDAWCLQIQVPEC